MAKTTVVNQDYEYLQQSISKLTQDWFVNLQQSTLVSGEIEGFIQHPVIPTLDLKIDTELFIGHMKELMELLNNHQPHLTKEINEFISILSKDTAAKLAKSALLSNSFYFEKFAQENQLPAWLVAFVVEQAIRPFLRKITSEIKTLLDTTNKPKCCPACGESARLALINKQGKKEITCPRCYYAWQVKKISCAHCDNEEHEKLVILKVEGAEGAEIHACQQCNGYTKVVDTRKLIEKVTPELADIQSLHLDFIAQEKGFMMNDNEKLH